MRKIKLIWDFRGETGLKIAEHHSMHLKEYVELNDVNYLKVGYESKNELYAIAFLAIYETELIAIRDTLKPHRAELFIEN